MSAFVLFVRVLGSFILECMWADDESLKGAKRWYVRKCSIVASDRLDEGAEVGPSDTEYVCPVLLRVQIAIRQNEQTLVRLWSQLASHNHIEKVFCIELLSLCIDAYASFDQLVYLKVLEVKLSRRLLVAWALESREEYLYVLHKGID